MNQYSPYNRPDPGPGVAAGFWIGVLAYIFSFGFVISVLTRVLPASGFTIITFANLLTHLLLNGGLILYSLGTDRKKFAKGLIIAASIAFLLDSACWGFLRV